MAVPRPILLALLGTLLGATLFMTTTVARKGGDDSGAPASTGRESLRQPKRVRGDGERPKPARTDAARRQPARSGAARPRPTRTDAARPKTRPARPKTHPKTPTRPAGVPAAVTRALARKHTVVFFFFQPGAAEDAATAKAVDSLRGRKGVEVFSVPLSRLADYRAVTGAAGVSQAPAVVIVARERRARVIEGFVDGETLAQEVADAR